MQWAESYRALTERFVAIYPVPQKQAGETQDSLESRCREWVRKLAEQFAFSIDVRFGNKSSSQGSIQSKDVLAYKDDALHGWDMLFGTGTGYPELNNPGAEIPDHELVHQAFIPVAPINWIAEPGPEPPVPPVPPGDLEYRVARIENFLSLTFKEW